MRPHRLILIALALLLPGAAAHAGELVIATARGGPIVELARAQAERLYLGRTTTLADNAPVTLIDLPPGTERDQFYLALTGKNPVQIRAYWSRQVFTGRAMPPRQADSAAQMREWLLAEPAAIGYLPAEEADGTLRVLLRLPPP